MRAASSSIALNERKLFVEESAFNFDLSVESAFDHLYFFEITAEKKDFGSGIGPKKIGQPDDPSVIVEIVVGLGGVRVGISFEFFVRFAKAFRIDGRKGDEIGNALRKTGHRSASVAEHDASSAVLVEEAFNERLASRGSIELW